MLEKKTCPDNTLPLPTKLEVKHLIRKVKLFTTTDCAKRLKE